VALTLRGLNLATDQRTGFKNPLEAHCRFLVGLSRGIPRLRGTGVPISLFSLPHADNLPLRNILQRETGPLFDPAVQTCFPTHGAGIFPG
jgi:hypothetical protein